MASKGTLRWFSQHNQSKIAFGGVVLLFTHVRNGTLVQ